MSQTSKTRPIVESVAVAQGAKRRVSAGKNDGTATVPLIPYASDANSAQSRKDGIVRGHLIVGESGRKYIVAVMPIESEVKPIDAKNDGSVRKQYTLELAWLETDFILPKGSPDMEYLPGKFVPIEGEPICLSIRATTDNLVETASDQKKKGKSTRPSVRF